MYNPFNLFKKIVSWFRDDISARAKIIFSVAGLLFSIGLGFAGYKLADYVEHNPKACLMCHVHDEANNAWAKSVHNAINCHECHQATKKEQVSQMYKFAFLGQKAVSPRHGNVIVAWKVCYKCHWEGDNKYPAAPLVNRSRYHAKHVFIERVECTKCHGYVIHNFLPEERFCFKCHAGKEVHGTGMENLACLNCHTDRTADLRPGRKKCLFCHGSESIRKELIDAGTIDVKYFQPSPEIIKKAIKINVPGNAPMQFKCYECHKPHTKIRPDYGKCLTCHGNIPAVGKHELHVKTMGMKCIECHKPHSWRITNESAKKECVKCHEYKEPKKFIS